MKGARENTKDKDPRDDRVELGISINDVPSLIHEPAQLPSGIQRQLSRNKMDLGFFLQTRLKEQQIGDGVFLTNPTRLAEVHR